MKQNLQLVLGVSVVSLVIGLLAALIFFTIVGVLGIAAGLFVHFTTPKPKKKFTKRAAPRN